MYNYLLLLFSCFIYSQSTTIKVLSSNDKLPIEKTLLYSDHNFLGQTNIRGEFIIDTKFEKLILVKENYQDVEFSLEELKSKKWIIELDLIKMVQLDTIVITKVKENPENILEKIKQSRYKQNQSRYKFYQSKVDFICDNSTIYLFNNIIYPSEGLKANDINEIIYKGYRKQLPNRSSCEVFTVFDKEVQIPVQSTVFCSLTEFVLTPIFEGKVYQYLLEKTDDFYILKFLPKKDNSKLLYEGYFIIDKYDFGIVELNLNLAESKNNIWQTNSCDLNTSYEYKILEDSFKFKFSKIDDTYFLESSSRKMQCEQTKGSHIGKKFSFTFNNEETLDHSSLIYKDYDFLNNKFK
jgi:hypothetical protein